MEVYRSRKDLGPILVLLAARVLIFDWRPALRTLGVMVPGLGVLRQGESSLFTGEGSLLQDVKSPSLHLGATKILAEPKPESVKYRGGDRSLARVLRV